MRFSLSRPRPSEQWQKAVLAYAAHLNDYIARGDACGWKGMGEPPSPPELQALLPGLLAQLRAAQGDEAAIAAFRAQHPPLHEATQPLIDANGQGIAALAWLADGTLLVRTGAHYEPGLVLRLQGVQATPLPDVEMFGISPGQQVLALAGSGQVRLLRNSDQQLLAQFALPQGHESLPPGFPTDEEDESKPADQAAPQGTRIQQLVPLDDASGVAVVLSQGIFFVSAQGVQRLLPTAGELQETLETGQPYPVRLDMAHAACSADGRWLLCGHQSSAHCVFERQANLSYKLVDEIGPHGEYPHHAAFFAGERHAAFNACHFYNGGTIAVDVGAFGQINTAFYEEHPALTLIDDSARVYASAPADNALVLGDAHGYLWARTPDGELAFKQHVGGTISAMATSADGRWLAVGTYTGTVHLIDLHGTQPNPEQVGLRARREARRWLFWKQEAQPLAW